MQNEEGKNVDLYIPRKCSWTNRLIGAQDHASVSLNVAKVDASGMYTGQSHAFALAGYIRAKVSAPGLHLSPGTLACTAQSRSTHPACTPAVAPSPLLPRPLRADWP